MNEILIYLLKTTLIAFLILTVLTLQLAIIYIINCAVEDLTGINIVERITRNVRSNRKKPQKF